MSIDIKERIRAVIDGDLDLSSVFYRLRAILDDLDAEPPKPTGEQLKAIGKVLDGDRPRICKDGDYIFDGEDFIFNCHSQRGELRWHLKDAPTQPDFVTCKYFIYGVTDDDACTHPNKRTAYDTFGYCDRTEAEWRKVSCPDYEPKPPAPMISKPTGEPIAFKRPCSTCGHQGNIMDKYCGSCGIEHLNWIPKPPEGHGKDYPAEQPALMICNHAGECDFSGCTHKDKHEENDDCCQRCDSVGGIRGAVCVPWVEPVVHRECDGCAKYIPDTLLLCWPACADKQISGGWLRRNWTAKQPEPAAPGNLCLQCKYADCWVRSNTIITCAGFAPKEPEPAAPEAIRVPGFGYIPKEPKAEPGLVLTMRQEIENVLAYLRTAPHAEFKRENLIAFCESLMTCKE